MKSDRTRACQKMICFMAVIIFSISISCFFGTAITIYAQGTQLEPAAEKDVRAESAVEPETGTGEAAYTDKQGIIYTYDSQNSCRISGCTKNIESTIKIPVKISSAGGNYKVKGIGAGAFQNRTALKQVEIPNSITDIAADAFSGCRNLKSISVLPVENTLKRSGKTSVTTVKISGALLCAPAEIELEIDETVMRKSVSDTKADAVTLQICMKGNSSYPIKTSLPGRMILLQKAVKAIAGSGKELKVRIQDAEGSIYNLKVSAEDLKRLSGNLQLALWKKEAGDTTGTLKSDLKKAINKNGLNTDHIEIFTYSFEKDSKTNMSIVLSVQNVKGVKSGNKVYVYRYDKNKRVFAAVSFHPYTVSKQGNITVPVSKGGTFVVSDRAFQYMSRQPADEFLTESGSTYYVDKEGKAVRGWKKIGSQYYYFDRENGKMSVKCREDGIKIKADGTAEKTEANVNKIQTMIKARAVVEQITNPSDSRSRKIEKCFRWILQFPYRRYRRLKPICRQPGWEVTFANDIFDSHRGCCVSEASAAAFLFHECGYKTVYVACDTGHAWVELNGRVYDPLFAEDRGFSQFYNIPYTAYSMRPVIKRKI